MSDPDPGPVEVPGTSATDASMTVVGNATVLLRLGSFTLLTDPNFLHRGERAKLGYGLRSKRLSDPALTIDQLPPLDAVVLSHHHGDHFDDRAAEGLDADLPIVTTPHAARKLGRQGFTGAVPLDTWQAHRRQRPDGESLSITALPGRHGPLGIAVLLPTVMGSMLEWSPPDDAGGPVRRLYITGDTLVFDGLRQIARRYPDIDCSLIHLGGTRVLGVLLTMDGEQGRRALQITGPRHAVPIHHSDYTVMRSPLAAFTETMTGADAPAVEVVTPTRGAVQPIPGWRRP